MSQWRGAIQEISDVVRRLCRCASDASTSNLSISSGGMLLGLWHETAKQMVLKPENLIASTWKDIDEYRQLMIADSEAVTVIVQHIHQLVLNNAHHLPAVMSELSVGVENCVQRVRMLEATTVLGAIVFQRAGLVAQDRNLLSVAELVSVVYEVLRGLQDLAEIPSKPEELSSPTQERPKKGSWNGVKSVMRKGGFFNPAAVNVPAQTLLSHFAPAPAAENLASHDWSVLNEKLREFNRSAKSLVRAMNYYLDTLLMIEHQLILTGECQTDAAGLGKDALLRMRDTLQAILASQQHNRHTWRISFKEIPQFISISNGSSDQSSDNMEVPVNDSRKHTIDSSAMSDFGRDYPENLKRRSPNPVHSSIQTLCNEGDSRMNSVHNASESYLKHESSNDRGYTLPDKGFDDGNYRQPRSFSMGKPGKQAYRPTKLRRQISAPDPSTTPLQWESEHSLRHDPERRALYYHGSSKEPDSMPEPATATSTFPQPEQPEHETENPLQSSPYEALLRHIEEIEHAQLQMLGQVPFPDEAMEGHQEQLAMMPEEFADHHNAQLGTPSMATYVPPPRVLVFPPSQNPEDPMITSVTLGPDLQAGGLAGEAHRQPHFLRPRVPPPKVAVTYMKREWEPSLSVKKPLLRPDSGSTAWKLCAIKLNPTNRTLQVYGSDAISTTKFSIKDMEIPIRDPELSGHAPVAQYNLRNAVLEKASNAARSHTVRVRLMNGVSLVISFASAITLEEWALALTRTANDESGSMPMIRDGSGYVEYPSASSFHPLSAMAL